MDYFNILGANVRALRIERKLTQEQLATKLNVSGRTVSRWETGTTMPDMSLLCELAEFYQISISEIIDGQRRNEQMNEEVKETALKLSDYTNVINQQLKKRLLYLTTLALLGMLVFIFIEAFTYNYYRHI